MIIETKIRRNYGIDHEYIVQPPALAKLWTDITGRKTVTATDLEQIHRIGSLFHYVDVSKAIVIEREVK